MPLDAIVLGKRVARATEHLLPVVAVIRFLDNGQEDDKLICSNHGLGWADMLLLKVGFRVYVLMKRIINLRKEVRGATKYLGLEVATKKVAK